MTTTVRNKRKQHKSVDSFCALGHNFAAWLNRQDATNETVRLIKFLVATERLADEEPRYTRYEIPLKMHALLGPKVAGRTIGPPTLDIVPEDEESWAFLMLRDLVSSGNAGRLRFCQNCKMFWYCAGRAHQGACSVRCKVALWQRTPRGRERRRKYVKSYRARLRQEAERFRRQKKLTLKRERNLRPSLNKS